MAITLNGAGTGTFTDASGNVGIGTASPTAKLDIASGNLAFSSTAQRITGDFSNATVSSRLLLQTSTANSTTSVASIPSGTGTTSLFASFNNSDPTNASWIGMMAVGSTDARFQSSITGTGTYLPMTFYTGGSERARFDTSGRLGIGTASATAMLQSAGTSAIAAAKVPNILEPATVSATAATGTIQYDVTTQSILYYTSNAAANWTVNFRGSSGTSLDTLMATNDVVTVTFLVTQGATPYYNNAVTVDSASVTPKYQGGTAWTAGNASGIDVYTYTIIKTASATFTVLASQTQFK